jgi:CRP/FNR family transcriptional regulator
MSDRRGAGVDALAMADLVARAPGATAFRASAGDVLFRPEDRCRGFIALRSGVVRVGLNSAAGRALVLYRVRPGEICLQTFSCLAENRAYAAEGVADCDLEGVMLPPAAFDRLMVEDAAFRGLVLSSVAARFSDLEDMVQALVFTGLPSRLAGALLSAASAQGVLHTTHEALAAEIGSAREAVGRQLALFTREGLVRGRRGEIVLVDRAGLMRLRDAPA